jgi:hypothetical protein
MVQGFTNPFALVRLTFFRQRHWAVSSIGRRITPAPRWRAHGSAALLLHCRTFEVTTYILDTTGDRL